MTRATRTTVESNSGTLPPEEPRPAEPEDRAELDALAAKLAALKAGTPDGDASAEPEEPAHLAPRIVQSAGPKGDHVSKSLDDDPMVDPLEAEVHPHATGLPDDAEPDRPSSPAITEE